LNIPVVGLKPVSGPRDIEVVAQLDHLGRYGFQRKGARYLVTSDEAMDFVNRGLVALPSNEETPAPVAVVAVAPAPAVEPVKLDKRTKAYKAASR